MNKLYIDSFVEKKLTAGVQLLDEKDFSNIKEKKSVGSTGDQVQSSHWNSIYL